MRRSEYDSLRKRLIAARSRAKRASERGDITAQRQAWHDEELILNSLGRLREGDTPVKRPKRNPQTKMKGRAKSIRLRNFTGTVRQNPDKTITVKGLNHKAAKKRAPARKRATSRKRKR